MAHFVAGDENNLRSVHFGDGRVPDDDALRSANSADVGVHLGRFFAGPHPEHALGRNIDARVLHHFFQLAMSAGSFCWSGSNLWNIGSMTNG